MFIVADIIFSRGLKIKRKKLRLLVNIVHGFIGGEPSSTHKSHPGPCPEGILIFSISLCIVNHHRGVNHVAWSHCI